MARSLSSLKKRMATITTTQKITNTMKLVSMSKLQRYANLRDQFKDYYNALMDQPLEAIQSDKEKLAICIVPDLGLVSTFTKGILNYCLNHEIKHVLWIGHQNYETIERHPSLFVHNDKISSEKVTKAQLQEMIDELKDSYNLVALEVGLIQRSTMKIEEIPVFYSLKFSDTTLYEPNFEEVSTKTCQIVALAILEHIRLLNKASEHMLRQIAMDKASESAEDMLDSLKQDYNKLRQERITQEISEIVSGKEVSE